ncbi:MAG: aminopeptidase [Lysobacteraceae bacterium]|nr:MAG: aminopeptidase [Xanthomonadaceae bacterium]
MLTQLLGKRRNNRIHRAVIVTACIFAISACQSLGYYGHLAKGQWQIMSQRQPIDELIAADDTDPQLRAQLQDVQAMLKFAETDLQLASDGSYSSYVDLSRDHANWIVVAAPEFSLEAKTWCFPVVGCVPYRGYFSADKAEQQATELRDLGFDVRVFETGAYSTLGWFDDPVLSSMLAWERGVLAETLFHELAHQRLYRPNHADFNESFATAVGRYGARLWFAEDSEGLSRYEQYLSFDERYRQALQTLRQQWHAIYALAISEDEKRARRRLSLDHTIAQFDQDPLLAATAATWRLDPPNNADLALLATYYSVVARFEQLLALNDNDLLRFYQAAENIAAMDDAAIDAWIKQSGHKAAPAD